ncbi:MAG: hypothetical protein IRZ00_19920, partial [Gemmatimonadetes bacterium]|nr:hypothetical protein [Gemmatimonadota bacterium]
MLEGESCRAGARRLGIDKTTAWRWRHRLLERLRERLLDPTSDASVGPVVGVPRGPDASSAVPAALLGGTVELLEARVLVCRKGERNLGRPALRRGRRFPILPGLGGPATTREPVPASTLPATGVRLRDERGSVASEIATLLLAHDRREHARATLVWHAAPPTTAELAALLGLPSHRPEPNQESKPATLHATPRATRHATPHTAGHAPPDAMQDAVPHAAPHATSPAAPHAVQHAVQDASGPMTGDADAGWSQGGKPVAAGRIAAGGVVLRLLSRGRLHSPYGDLARSYGLDHRRAPFSEPGWQTADPRGRRPPRRAEHLGTASSALRRLRAWLRRFHGVATKYLLRYWAWHRFLDVLSREAAIARLLAIAR